MHEIYKKEVPEFQCLWAIYETEKKMARKQGKLKSFPSFEVWKLKGNASQSSADLYPSLMEGQHETIAAAHAFHEHTLVVKEHSHSYLYTSAQHPRKAATTVCYSPKSEASSSAEHSLTPCFVFFNKIFHHSFAKNILFVWADVHFFEEPKFIEGCKLWCSKDSVGRTSPILLHHLSHPLTIAVDKQKQIWFHDAFC